jgi:hypothetical protein
LARIGSVAYRIQLPPQARIHDVFHVALLKMFVGSPPSGSLVPLPSWFTVRWFLSLFGLCVLACFVVSRSCWCSGRGILLKVRLG